MTGDEHLAVLLGLALFGCLLFAPRRRVLVGMAVIVVIVLAVL